MKTVALAVVMAVTLLVAKGSMVFAAQEIQGSDAKSQAVEVTADVKSMYSVSMPASIELTLSEISKVYIDGTYTSSAVEGYWGTIVYGCAGKIDVVVNLGKLFAEVFSTLADRSRAGNFTAFSTPGVYCSNVNCVNTLFRNIIKRESESFRHTGNLRVTVEI